MDYTVLDKTDLNKPEVKELLNTIKEKNYELYTQIFLAFEKKDVAVCREDVLQYLAENAKKLYKDTLYIYHIASLMENIKLEPSWYEWVNNYFCQGGGAGVDEFMIVLGEAIEKEIPLKDTIRLFEQGDEDILTIYEAIDEYNPHALNKGEESEESLKDELDVQEKVSEEHVVQTVENETVSNSDGAIVGNNMDNFTGLFESLVKVMSIKGRSMDNGVLDVQDNLNKIVAKFQLAITELSAYSTEIIREWEKDKEENERLLALNKLQQKALENQQRRINSLRDENSILLAKIQDANKSELRRAGINKKLSELQSLISEQTTSVAAFDWPDELI